MKENKRYLLGCLLALALVVQLLPGCIMIGRHDAFDYQLSEKEASGEFMPYLYIKHNTLNIPLLLFRVDIDRLPHSMVMLQYDQTYKSTDEGFESFVLDTLSLTFSDGSKVECINPERPVEERTFTISNKENRKYQKHVFDGVITQRQDFTVHTIGTSIKADGQKVRFKRITKYRFSGRAFTFRTILDEWASI